MKIPPRPKTNSPKASGWKPGQDIMWGDMMIAPDHPKYNEYASRLKAGAKPPGGMPLPPKRTQPKLDPGINTVNPLDQLDQITQARDIYGNEIKTADMLVSGGVNLQKNQRAERKASGGSGGSGGSLQFRMVNGQVRVVGSDAQKNASGTKGQPQPSGMTLRPTTDEEKKIYSGMR